jgi:hypothetical protein
MRRISTDAPVEITSNNPAPTPTGLTSKPTAAPFPISLEHSILESNGIGVAAINIFPLG